MKGINKIFILFFFIITTTMSFAQTSTDDVEMADIFRSSGKIYVVITVLSVVLIGLILFLVRIDRKVSKLEKEIGERKN